ncbi:MAG: S8 family serine peptidase [Vicinamibacterales bacterium]
MVRRLLLSVVVVGLGLTPLASAPPPPQSPLVIDRARVFRPGELLVGFRPGAGPPEISGVYQLHGLEEKENLDPGPLRPALRRVAFPLATAEDPWEQTERVITRLMRHPLVRFAEPNYIFHTSQLPNDQRFGELYGLHNTGQTNGRPDADVDAPEAWDRTTGSSTVIVFVIDTGVDYRHEDLAGNLWTNTAEASGLPNVDDDGNGYVDDVHGINAITGSGDPADDMGHGTHVAGTIGAEGNNGIGAVGVTWDVRIGACKFLGNTGSGTLDDAVECFQYVNRLKAAGHNILVTNNSWGGGGFSQALEDAMAGLDQPTIQPILHACAAGNENTNNDVFPNYPPSYDLPNVVAVAATDHQDVYAGFSNYGATSVHVAAPGVAILSTVPSSGHPCCSDPTGYRLLSGTSMATPFVSGAAALVWSANPGLTAAQVRSRLLGGVDYIGELGANAVKPTVTDGRLNVSSALEVGEDLVPPAAVTTLTVTGIGLSSATLGWDATGDDDFTGTASSFDVRYSTNAITDANWSSTIRAIGEPAPQLSGSPQTFTVSGLSPGQTYYFGLKARDNVGNESILSNIAVASTVAGTTVFEDDMSVSGAWVVAGTPSPPLWHRSQRRSNSPAYSWWYGREATGTYNTGAANWGTLTTSINLADYGEAVLTFAEWSQVEATPQFDRTRVQASIDGATWNTVFESHGTNDVWAERLVDLSAYAGQTVQLRFYLDTFDPLLNDYEGWYIDDVRVVGLPPGGPFAAFSGNPTVGFAPLLVRFTDQSVSNEGTISAWVWTFGAGPAGSTDKNPEYTYANPGSYTVTLTVTDSNGSQAARTKTGYITVRRTARVASVTYARNGSRGKDLLITLKVVNWAGAAIGGATVTANVNRGSALAKSFTGTTNLDGTVTFKLRNAGSDCYSAVVTALSSTNHEWDGQTPGNSSCN